MSIKIHERAIPNNRAWLIFLLILILIQPVFAFDSSFTGKCISIAGGYAICGLHNSNEKTIGLASIDCLEIAQDSGDKAKPVIDEDAVKSASFDGQIEIIGKQSYLDQVSAALTLLKEKAPQAYYIVETYVKRIEEAGHSGMAAYANPPTFYMADRTAFYSVTWCASSIAHDSYHSKMYFDYASTHNGRVPDDVYSGFEAERKCISYQLSVAEAIGAPKREVKHIKASDGTHIDINKDGKYDENDWYKNDW